MTTLVVALGCMAGIVGVLVLRVSAVLVARKYARSGFARARAEKAGIRWRKMAGEKLCLRKEIRCREGRKLARMGYPYLSVGAHVERCGICAQEVGCYGN